MHIQLLKKSQQRPARPRRQPIMSWLMLTALLLGLTSPAGIAPAYAQEAPTLLAPANGVIVTAIDDSALSGELVSPPVALPEFSWQAVPGATRYLIQISETAGFNPNTYKEYTTQLTSFIPMEANLFRDGVWYWRVRVQEPTVGAFSSSRNFTKQWASPGNKPSLISPTADAAVEFFDAPTFSWAPVVGASRYRLEIDSSPSFIKPYDYERLTLATSHQPESKLANGEYYWRVVPIDPGGQEPAPSSLSYRRFTMNYNQVPTLLEPANNSYPTFTPTFRWRAVRGAQFYRLQYSTDPTFNTAVTTIDTRNTTYTPQSVLPNDVNYYWRVKAISGSDQSASAYSPYWTFRKQWYIRPVPLTPTNGYQHVRIPYFSWSPVPGASNYVFQMDGDTDFQNLLLTEETSNPFYTPRVFQSNWNIVYWRVVPKDAAGNLGKESDVFSFTSRYTETVPVQIYPFYYYPPNSFPPPFNTVQMNPYADRTVPYPVFIWHRLTSPPPNGGTFPFKYRLQVSTSPLFESIVWTVDTENTHAAPTTANPFTPVAGQDYYWRVRPLDNSGAELTHWSQIWRTRITVPTLTDLPDAPPVLRRPLYGAEIVDTTPLLEWYPVKNAASYQVRICSDAACTSVVNSGQVAYPFYSSTTSLAQRVPLSRVNFGTYYWQVRALNSGGSPLGDWSPVSRFQIAAQSERLATRTVGNPANQLLIATDPDDVADDNFELTTLTATQSNNYWYFGFNATAAATNMRYALYLDVNHLDNSGGDSDPRGYTVNAIAAHRPEFVIYINQVSGSFAANQVEIYRWNGIGWNPPVLLNSVGGALSWAGGFVELQIPNTQIGMQDDTGSYAVALFSVPNSAPAIPVDTAPSDAGATASGLLSRFTSVSERLNPIMPPNTAEGDPASYPFVYPFFWDNPVGYNSTAPWAGAQMKVYRDPLFTTLVAEFKVEANPPYYSMDSHHWPSDFLGDNTYYWRIQPRYLMPGEIFGVWSQGQRFERKGFTPKNLTESVNFATPTFSWDIVEGAREYELWIDEDSNFSSPFNYRTPQNSFTPVNTLPGGAYFWKVRVIRADNATSDWSATKTFTLTMPTPTNLTPNNPDPNQAISGTPTFCWTPVLVSQGGVPVLAAYRYRLEVSRGDPNFSQLYETVDTQQACWTPTRGYDDGTYYWRVAIYDGDSRLGGYSSTAVFTKQYPLAKPKSPLSGSTIGATPTFVWTAADGVTPYVFGAARYQLQVASDVNYGNLIETAQTNNTRFTPTRSYPANQTLYWRVAIIDADGKIGPYSDATVVINPYPNKVFVPLVIR